MEGSGDQPLRDIASETRRAPGGAPGPGETRDGAEDDDRDGQAHSQGDTPGYDGETVRLLIAVCLAASSFAGIAGGSDRPRDRREWEPDFRRGVMTWDTYVATNAPGAQTFSWLYSPLLLDALGYASSSPRFERPPGWNLLVESYRPVVAGEERTVREHSRWNDIYVDRVTLLPLEGRHPRSSVINQNQHVTHGSYVGASDQERLIGLLPATSQRLLAYADRESRRSRVLDIDRPVAPPLPAPANPDEEFLLALTLGNS